MIKILQQRHVETFTDDQGFEHRVVHPRIGLCSCGNEVQLDGFTNACECGQEYNSAGQLLAPREEWGWDTGEDWRDLQDL